MRNLKEIETDIEQLRKKLNVAIYEEKQQNHVPANKVLLLSQEMDKLINEYQEASRCK